MPKRAYVMTHAFTFVARMCKLARNAARDNPRKHVSTRNFSAILKKSLMTGLSALAIAICLFDGGLGVVFQQVSDHAAFAGNARQV